MILYLTSTAIKLRHLLVVPDIIRDGPEVRSG